MNKWLLKANHKILIASLLFNIFFVGLFSFGLISGNIKRALYSPSVYRMMKNVNEDTRPLFENAYEKRKLELRAARKEYQSANQAFIDALKANPFDTLKFNAASEAKRSARIQISKVNDSIILDVFPNLDVETREKIAATKRYRRARKSD